MRPFNASNQTKTCLWCGSKLRPSRWAPGKFGPYRDGFFCTGTCARLFATSIAAGGHRLQPLTETEKRTRAESDREKTARAKAALIALQARVDQAPKTGGTT